MATNFLRPKFLEIVRQDRSVRYAFLAWILSRAIVIGLFIITSSFTFSEPSFGGEVHEPSISLKHVSIASSLRKTAQAADANWYMQIAGRGYDKEPFVVDRQHTWAFFPLYPLNFARADAFHRRISAHWYCCL